MLSVDGQRLLIISNNVLSYTRNNGKTILSYIDCLPPNCIGQLYFSREIPEIASYKYFQINDLDVIKGHFFKRYRGHCVESSGNICDLEYKTSKMHTYNTFTRLLREIIWAGAWKSPQLNEWIEKLKPTAIFFLGGDSCFAYKICNYITKYYNLPLTLFITDDYLLPRRKESILQTLRRKIVCKNFKKCLLLANSFFTISEPMQLVYKEKFGRESIVIMNMTDTLKDENYLVKNSEIIMIYAGSLYYGRSDVLKKISESIHKINKIAKRKVTLKIYSEYFADNKISKDKNTLLCGSLTHDQLKKELNKADILVFVESFELENIDKIKYSLSTKIPEYLSLQKPIFAVGPKGIGSMDYLKNVAMCVNDLSNVYLSLKDLVFSEKLQKELSDAAYGKFNQNHNKRELQNTFIKAVFDNTSK